MPAEFNTFQSQIYYTIFRILYNILPHNVGNHISIMQTCQVRKIRMCDQGRCEDIAFGGEVRFTAWIVSIHLILRRPRGAIMVGAEQKILKIWIP
jgi:hypothetical protein